jgi:hypothetical protein
MCIAMLDKVQLRICRAVEWGIRVEIVIAIHADNVSAAPLHTLEEQKIRCNVLVNQVEREERVPQMIEDTHKDDEIEPFSKARHVPHCHPTKFDINLFYLRRKSCLSEIVLIGVNTQHLGCTATLHFKRIEARIASDVQHALAGEISRYRMPESRELCFRIVAEEMIRRRLYAAEAHIMKPWTKRSDIVLQCLIFRHELS